MAKERAAFAGVGVAFWLVVFIAIAGAAMSKCDPRNKPTPIPSPSKSDRPPIILPQRTK